MYSLATNALPVASTEATVVNLKLSNGAFSFRTHVLVVGQRSWCFWKKKKNWIYMCLHVFMYLSIYMCFPYPDSEKKSFPNSPA